VPVFLAEPAWPAPFWRASARTCAPGIFYGPVHWPRQPEAPRCGVHLPGTIMIPTGGTGGRLKFAIHTWGTLASAAGGFSRFYGAARVSSVCCLPLHHVSGLMQLVRAFESGGEVAFVLWKTLEAGHFAPPVLAGSPFLSLAPTQLVRLLRQAGAAGWLRCFRAVLAGGGPVAPGLVREALAARIPLSPVYGATETAAAAAAALPEELTPGAATLYARCLPHARLVVHAPPGRPGPVEIGGPSLFHGYFPDAPIRRTRFETGDTGSIDLHGRLHLVGRSDRLVITGGEKVDPRTVEDILLRLGAREALAVGLPDREWGERLAAFYVAPADRPLPPETAARALREELPAHAVPKNLLAVHRLPLDTRGKLDRARLAHLLETAPGCP